MPQPPLSPRFVPATLALLLAAAAEPVAAATPGDPGCRPAAAGGYVVMEQGSAGELPMARRLQEQWHADGRLEGVLMERRGQAWRERAYVGRLTQAGSCQVRIERLLAMDPPGEKPLEVLRSGAVLDAAGRPAYSLDLAEGTVLTGRWWSQPAGTCRATTLTGVVLSQQQGLSWQDGRWRPNAVVQRELWREGTVLADGRGYLYLQTDPSDLTVGWLERR